MSETPLKTSRPRAAMAVGLAVTLVVLGLHLVGLDRRAEWATIDWRLKHFTPPHRSDDIVHIDIDDRALAELGRWPWPRTQQARIVQTLTDAGAKAVVMDILLPDMQDEVHDTRLASALAGNEQSALAFVLDFDSPDIGSAEMDRLALPVGVSTASAPTGQLTPPLATFRDAVAHAGFVTCRPDADGVTRRVRPVGQAGDELFGQLSLVVAASDLATTLGPLEAVTVAPGALTLTFAGGATRVLPLDADGRVLINWQRGLDYSDHVSAAAVVFAAKQQDAIGRNRQFRRLILRDMTEVLGDSSEMDRLIEQGDLAAIDRHGQERLAFVESLLVGDPPTDPDDLASYELLMAMRDRIRQLDDADALLEADLQRFRSRIDGRICLIGSTTTGAADFVATPIDPLTPGVVVHANLIEMIRTGRFLRQPAAWVTLASILAAGWLTSLLVAHGSLIRGVLGALVLSAGYVGFVSLVALPYWGLLPAIVGPVAAAAATLLVVAIFRELTEERAKKHIRGMFAHALSGELVDQLLANPSLATVGGQRRRITSMFTDLAGFTAMAEQLGPEQTVAILNRYFDRMTTVIQGQHGGYINKFLGDGMFCLFGAPVMQRDHAARALRAAADIHRALESLNAELTDEGVAAGLHIRVGLATDEAMVGNCGSSERMDYTAIGDCVNLSSRLESANKVLSAGATLPGIIVTDVTWRDAAVDLPSRAMGALSINGFDEPIALRQVFVETDTEFTASLVQFASALEAYEAGQFARASEMFNAILAERPDDLLAWRYAAAACYAASFQPGELWRPPAETSAGPISFPMPAAISPGDER
jgi:CHASE2 domain-containing sensor protein/class 3 adenylate cyclase